MDPDIGSNFSEDDLVVTVKLLTQEPEVLSVSGENEKVLKQIRAQTGASITVSEGSVPDRIVTITGTIEEMYDACKLILQRFETYFVDDNRNENDADIVVKLIVPAAQCGPLIGKGGSKIKEIRDTTGASMQVAADVLPSSTERIVHISGTIDAILDCVSEISIILLTTPQKFQVIPYRPSCDLLEGPIVFSGGKVYTLQGSSAIPIADLEYLYKNDLMKSFFGLNGPLDYNALTRLLKPQAFRKEPNEKKKTFMIQELRVPDDAISGMYGRQGIKVSEIRQITGAMITLSSPDSTSAETRERLITIKGTQESVALAKYLINASIELQKMNSTESQMNNSEQLDGMESESATASLSNSLTRPGAINTLSTIVGFSNISEFLNSFDSYYRH